MKDVRATQFAVALIECGGNQTEAYRQIVGATGKPESQWQSASRAFRDVKVRSRVNSMLENAVETTKEDADSLVKELNDLISLAKADDQFGTAARCIEIKARLIGAFAPEKREQVNIERKPSDLADKIEQAQRSAANTLTDNKKPA